MTPKSWQWDAILFVLASPVLAVRAVVRAVRRLRFLHQATSTSVACSTCDGQIFLVGFWKCGCGFTYQGHVLRYCPVCGSFPGMVRCYQCGATMKVRI